MTLNYLKFKSLLHYICLFFTFLYFLSPAYSQSPLETNLRIVLLNTQNHAFFRIDQPENDQLARLTTILKDLKQAPTPLMVIQMGDMISPALFSGFDQGAHLFDLMKYLPLDAMVLGNHEFDFGAKSLWEKSQSHPYAILSDNLETPENIQTPPLFRNKLISRGNLKIGLIGLTDTATNHKSSPTPHHFSDPIRAAQTQARHYKRQGADLIIALSHLSEAEESKIRSLPEIDVTLSHETARMLGASSFVSASIPQDAVWIVEIQKDPFSKKFHTSLQPLPLAEIHPDPEMHHRLAQYATELSQFLDIKIATLETDLDSRRHIMRRQESDFANLVTDALRTSVQADIALINAGSFRADTHYAVGTTLTRRNIQSELPFGNTLTLLELTGQEILQALENGVSLIDARDGRFPHVSGLSYHYSAHAEIGHRISQVKIANTPLSATKTYKVATNSYLAQGGDGYDMFKTAKRLAHPVSGSLISLRVMAYIAVKRDIKSKIEGRITRRP